MKSDHRDVALAVLIAASPAVLWPLGLFWWAFALVPVVTLICAWRGRARRLEVARLRHRIDAGQPVEIER